MAIVMDLQSVLLRLNGLVSPTLRWTMIMSSALTPLGRKTSRQRRKSRGMGAPMTIARYNAYRSLAPSAAAA
eukprot:8770047-Lingulodinium_polyedra.AAC.1